MSKVVVIGGGPAGMMAAIQAAQNGHKTVLLEKNAETGKKLAITGKGRCNVTNNCTPSEFIENVTVNARFLYGAINRFTPADTMSFFENQGVPLKTERGRRVFPQSDNAHDIVYAMRGAMKNAGVKTAHDSAVEVEAENGKVRAVIAKNGKYECDSVILATGGKSYPLTGSTGDGYEIAARLGHTIVPPKPSLVPLETAENDFESLSGLTLKNVKLTLKSQEGKILYEDFGEMLFTHFGISGPIILSASAHMKNAKKPIAVIDLKPALGVQQLDARLLREFASSANAELKTVMRRLLPSNMAQPFCARCGIDPEIKINAVTKQQRERIAGMLKGLSFTIANTRPISEAVVTSGGVSVSEIDPKTMQSKLVSGLYFAGELIDVDAYTGGYNLQIAFATGYVAGNSID